jgi:hypothetical protein
MTDLLDTSSAWLEDQRTRHLSQPVTYVRGAQSVSVLATIGRTVFNLDDGGGGVLRVESRDYLIRASDLVLGGQIQLPLRGDQIHEVKDGVVFIYEVLAPGDEPHYRFSDPYRRTLRIHSKQIDKETLP